MRRLLAGLLSLVVFAPVSGMAAEKSVLIFSRTQGFRHDQPINRSNPIFEGMAEALGYTCEVSEDPSVFDPDTISKWDLIIFNNTSGKMVFDGKERLDAFMSRIKGGAGFMGFHGAGDCFQDWPEYGRMLNGVVDGKPWDQEVRINIEEPDHPLLRPFKGEPFAVREEIFKFRDYDRTSARILMSLNDGGIDIQRGGRDDRDYATCWIRNWGDGRVYYSVHGHHAEVFEKTNFQEHVKLSMQWAIGDLQVDTAPSPALDREAIGAKALQSLRLATTADDRVAALHTLAWCPVEGALDLVVPLFKEDRRVASVAAEAAKALCENEKYLSKDRRVEILLAAFPLCSDAGVRKSIREGLQRLGVKDIPAAYSPGYLFIWWVAGPISGDPDEVRRKVFPPEKKVDIEKGFDVDGAHYAWRMAIANEDGILDLVEVFDSQANCAIYMYGEAIVEKEQDVELRFGSDDGFVAWLNGAEVSRFDGHRALRPGSEKAKVRLKAGANQILMKIDQKNGDWAGCAQIVGLDGKEADFTERTK